MRNAHASAGSQPPTGSQRQCHDKLKRAIAGGYTTGRCFNSDINIDTRIKTSRLATCDPMCHAKWSFFGHLTAACVGGFQGMAAVSNACWWRQIASVPLTVAGETESSSAEMQLDKGYLGRQCGNGSAGPRRTCVRRGTLFQVPVGHWSHPYRKPAAWNWRTFRSDEPRLHVSFPTSNIAAITKKTSRTTAREPPKSR